MPILYQKLKIIVSTFTFFLTLYHFADMPDAFFASEKKRKRPSRDGASSSRGRGGSRGSRGSRGNSRAAPSRRQHDSDVSEGESDAGAFDLDTVDFRQGRNETAQSDDDVIDEHETAAEKRVRLAKGYLAKVRSELAAGQLTIPSMLDSC